MNWLSLLIRNNRNSKKIKSSWSKLSKKEEDLQNKNPIVKKITTKRIG